MFLLVGSESFFYFVVLSLFKRGLSVLFDFFDVLR